ncbi:helix-turn-helix transcriptional regulator [Marinibaculum pumilum]|uniref:Helix-turn-helix transcriptional regulator n=1 Tax=Marinibaculum pumilum TaxID=1766165 RepID=A0ABV7L1Y8_9PROT
MQIRSFDEAGPSDGQVPVAAVQRLVAGIGGAGFTDAMLAFCAESFGASFVSIFAPGQVAAAGTGGDPATAPRLLGTATTTHPLNAAHAAEGYMRHYGEDANFRILTAAREQGLCLTYQRADEIADLGYRRACYDRTGIVDRLSLVRAGGRDRVALSLYRSRAAGPFADGLREAATGAFPLLLEVVDRHLASLPPAADASPAEGEARLRRRFPDLTPRECAVAARVLAGQSAARIAMELGIAESTVVTHRKRAYARIGVDGMKALFRA